MRKPVKLLAVALAASLLMGCATIRGSRGYFQVGEASWYGREYHGRLTASGERFNMKKMTAAHRTLPFDTRVRVTDLKTGRSVVVRINDRGPFVKGRVIDLSWKAARRLGILEKGVATVGLQIR